MSEYQVQKGDTIARVTQQFNTNWNDLRRNNPEAVGRSTKNGNWFLKEGATLKLGSSSFDESLQTAGKSSQGSAPAAAAPISIPRSHSKIVFRDPAPVPPAEPAAKESDTAAAGKGQLVEHSLKAGETLWELAVQKYHVNLSDILADNDITDPKTLQIGRKIKIYLPEKSGEEAVVASWYGKDFHGKPMANGEIYDMNGATIAHKDIPLGTRVELKNTSTGEMVQAVVTDRGPYVEGRDVDLSYGLAKKLSLVEQGVGNLVMRVL